MDRIVLSLLVDNTSGVLSRVAGLFSRRGYNIESLTVGVTADERYSRMTVVAFGDQNILEQIEKQLRKLEDVRDIKELKPSHSVYRELIMVKVRANANERQAVSAISDIFRATIVDVGKDSLTVMLTGDAPAGAELVAKDLGIDEVHAGLLPADKVAWVEKLLAQKPEKKELAFVGDGINDAPVLMRADIGIAMGALGSDAAIEAADIVLMDDDPAKISLAMRISRKCMRIAYENIVFALAVKAVCLVLTALGITNMWWGVFADVGVMVLAVLNATRMLNTRNYQVSDE